MGNGVKSTTKSGQCSDQPTGELEWPVAKALLNANSRTVQALEQHLLQTLYFERSQDHEETRRCIEQAITEHRRIIEDLEFATRMLDELSDEQKQFSRSG